MDEDILKALAEAGDKGLSLQKIILFILIIARIACFLNMKGTRLEGMLYVIFVKIQNILVHLFKEYRGEFIV